MEPRLLVHVHNSSVSRFALWTLLQDSGQSVQDPENLSQPDCLGADKTPKVSAKYWASYPGHPVYSLIAVYGSAL